MYRSLWKFKFNFEIPKPAGCVVFTRDRKAKRGFGRSDPSIQRLFAHILPGLSLRPAQSDLKLSKSSEFCRNCTSHISVIYRLSDMQLLPCSRLPARRHMSCPGVPGHRPLVQRSLECSASSGTQSNPRRLGLPSAQGLCSLYGSFPGLPLICRAMWTGSSPYRPQSQRQGRSPEETQKLFQELIELGTASGPRGALRSVQAVQAVLSVGGDYAQGLFSGVQVGPTTYTSVRTFHSFCRAAMEMLQSLLAGSRSLHLHPG